MKRLFLTGTYKDGLLWVQKRLEQLGTTIIRPDFGAGEVTISDIDAIVFLGKQTNDYFVEHFTKSGFPVFAPSAEYKKILTSPSTLKEVFGEEYVANYLEMDSVRDLISFFDAQEPLKKFVVKIYDVMSKERIETLIGSAEYFSIWMRDFLSKRPSLIEGPGVNFVIGDYIDGVRFSIGAFFNSGRPLKPYNLAVKSYRMIDGSNILKELPVWVFRFPILNQDLEVLDEWINLLSDKIFVGTNYAEVNFVLTNEGQLVITSVTNRLDPALLELYNLESVLFNEGNIIFNPHVDEKFYIISNMVMCLQVDSVLKIKSLETFDEVSVLHLRDEYYSSLDWYAGYQTVYGSDVDALVERASSLELFESPYIFCVKSKEILPELKHTLFLLHLNGLISSDRYASVLPNFNGRGN